MASLPGTFFESVRPSKCHRTVDCIGVLSVPFVSPASAAVGCALLATNPAYGLAGNPVIKSPTAMLITYVGANDQLIMPRGVINYYRQMAARYGINSNVPGIPNVPNFANVQGFYRLFRAPGVAHCGLGNGSPDNFFAKLVAWVEQGTTPDQLIETLPTKPTASTRPLCPYPQMAIWNKTGSPPYVASDFHCGGNLEIASTVCADVLIKEGHEASSAQPDFTDTGVNRNICGLAGKSAEAGK